MHLNSVQFDKQIYCWKKVGQRGIVEGVAGLQLRNKHPTTYRDFSLQQLRENCKNNNKNNGSTDWMEPVIVWKVWQHSNTGQHID